MAQDDERDGPSGTDAGPARALVATAPRIECGAGGRPAAPFLTQLLVAATDAGRTPRDARARVASRCYAGAGRTAPRKVPYRVA